MTDFGERNYIYLEPEDIEMIEIIMNEYPNEQSIIDNIENFQNKYILIVLAIQNNYNNLLRILLSDPNINLEKVLIIASANGFTETVRLLLENQEGLENKIDVQANYRALIEASVNGHIEIVRLLLDKGSDIHAINKALGWASRNGHIEIVRLLLEYGAGIHADNNKALRWASENGRIKIVKLLLEKGADIHAKNDYALRWASKKGYIEIVKLLLEKGAKVHAQNDEALRMASRNDHLEIVKLLLEKGANANINNNEPLRLASRNGRMEIVKLLLSDIRVDPYPNDINYIPNCENTKLRNSPFFRTESIQDNNYIRSIKRNRLLRATLIQYRNTIKENDMTIQTMRTIPPSAEYPLGGTEIRDADYRFNLNLYRDNKIREEQFKALYDYCTEEKTLPDINVIYNNIKIGEILNCIIYNELPCKNDRLRWLIKLRSIPHIIEELDDKLNRTQEVITESLDD